MGCILGEMCAVFLERRVADGRHFERRRRLAPSACCMLPHMCVYTGPEVKLHFFFAHLRLPLMRTWRVGPRQEQTRLRGARRTSCRGHAVERLAPSEITATTAAIRYLSGQFCCTRENERNVGPPAFATKVAQTR